MHSPLDPDDWEQFRTNAHNLLDSCIEQLRTARERPWKPLGDSAKTALRLGDAADGIGLKHLTDDLIENVLPFGTGNTHPRFFGWVHGTGLAAGLLAEMVAATMNSNCGGRDHGAVYVEREVIRWSAKVFGLPETASGVLVAGTSQATVIALAVARHKALGIDSRRKGIPEGARLVAYAAEGAHHAIVKAMELLGLGSDALRLIPSRSLNGGMDVTTLAQRIETDRAAGLTPFCVIGTAGSVNCGAFDPLDELADFCARESLWLHIDGAFGAWTRIAGPPWNKLVRGIERADSIATDFHKWMFVQYDCGMVLVRNEADHRAAFAERPSYLEAQHSGLGGGEPWFCDYGTDLSRGFRALKVWSALRCHGSRALGAAIAENCRLATMMGRLVQESPELKLAAPVTANICCFSVADSPDPGTLNTDVTRRLQLSGDVVFSTTKIGGMTVIRAAITNHRTRETDIEFAIRRVREVAAAAR
ncbi:MAG: hypothetical protein RL088_4241 [Verrucomicrobiota bacterium]|jgi:glutamate/tyrosine decarboxylase-like PLP-dependent enzyme